MTSCSFPKSQTPTFLPAKSSGPSMPESAHATDSVPERWKIWAMLMRSEPCSRASRTFGTQLIVNSGPSGAEPAACGMTSGPPGMMLTVSPSAAN